MSTLSVSTERLILVCTSAIAYWLVFQINDAYLNDLLFTRGVNLVYLPAGVKLLAILIAGPWGALGVGLSVFALSFGFWGELPVSALLWYAVLSTGVSYWILTTLRQRLGVQPDLCGITVVQLAMMDGVNSVAHGLLVNAYFFAVGARESQDIVRDGMAMSVGDFVGSGLLLSALWLTLRWRHRSVAQH